VLPAHFSSWSSDEASGTREPSLLSHQTRSSLAGAGDALIPPLGRNAWTAIHLPPRVGDFLNVLCQLLVFPLMFTERTLLPGRVAAQRHPKCLTKDTDGILMAIVFHSLVPHSWPCEKILTGLFSRSRSCRVLSSSRLRRRFSSSKAV
jgi:hypothetical protein